MNGLDARDWYVMVHIGGALVASTVFLFFHPDVFPTYCTFVGGVGAMFHWMVIKDSKQKDAE